MTSKLVITHSHLCGLASSYNSFSSLRPIIFGADARSSRPVPPIRLPHHDPGLRLGVHDLGLLWRGV